MDIPWLIKKGVERISTVSREELYLKMGVDLTRPTSVTCEVNERCNFKCQYCHFWQMPEYAPEISIAEWKVALAGLRSFLGRLHVEFIGGEPFLKQGFIELLEYCRDQGIEWGVITNGSAFTDRNVGRVVAALPTNIDISVDSPDPAVNDLVRGCPGFLNRIEAGLAKLRAERDARSLRLPIRIIVTVTRQNFRQLAGFAGWLKAHGADTVDFHPVHALPLWSEQVRRDLWPTAEEIAELRVVVEELILQRRNGAPIETSEERLRSIPSQFAGAIVPTSIRGQCRTGLRRFAIKAHGDVLSCWEFTPFGNIRHEDAEAIWRGPRAREMRKGTVACSKVGGECANCCLDSRSLKDDVKRGLLLLKALSAPR